MSRLEESSSEEEARQGPSEEPSREPSEDLLEEIRAVFGATTLPEDALAEIGRAVAQFAILEHTMFRLIQGLLGGQKSKRGERVVRTLTSEMSFRGLGDLSASLIRELHEDQVAADYKVVLKAVEAAETRRNEISHSLWGTTGAPGKKAFVRTKYTARRKKGLEFRRDELDMDDLRRNSRKIAVATFELRTFASRRLGIFTDY